LPNKLSTHLQLCEKYIISGKHLFGGIINKDEQKNQKIDQTKKIRKKITKKTES
jgi:hypothetical protein